MRGSESESKTTTTSTEMKVLNEPFVSNVFNDEYFDMKYRNMIAFERSKIPHRRRHPKSIKLLKDIKYLKGKSARREPSRSTKIKVNITFG